MLLNTSTSSPQQLSLRCTAYQALHTLWRSVYYNEGQRHYRVSWTPWTQGESVMVVCDGSSHSDVDFSFYSCDVDAVWLSVGQIALIQIDGEGLKQTPKVITQL